MSQEDIIELKQFAQSAKSPFVKALLEKQIVELSSKLASTNTNVSASPSVTPVETPSPLKVEKNIKTEIFYETIMSYSWEQTNDSAKIFVSLDSVGNLPPANTSVEFKANFVDIKVHGLNNKNYRFSTPLNDIKPSECSYKIRTDRIILNLKKKESGNWEKLETKKDKKKPDLDTKDPNAGLMELMKNMYEEGDDEMKRTIAKAWTESRDKKANPM